MSSVKTAGTQSLRPPDLHEGGGQRAAGVGEMRTMLGSRSCQGDAGRHRLEPVCPVDEAVAADHIGDEMEAPVEEEQAQVIKTLPTPYQPTRSEYQDHCVTHCPYRAWCPHCNEGRGREFGHTSHDHEPSDAPTVTFDYAFVGDKGEIKDPASEDLEGSIKILVVREAAAKRCLLTWCL